VAVWSEIKFPEACPFPLYSNHSIDNLLVPVTGGVSSIPVTPLKEAFCKILAPVPATPVVLSPAAPLRITWKRPTVPPPFIVIVVVIK
jgi:hypothetical protein